MNPLIHDLELIPLRVMEDERGAVLHMIRKDSKEFYKFGELYFSEILPGAIKAWKNNSKLTQLITVPRGKIRLVIYDDRLNSKSKGELQVIDLGRPDSYQLVKIPPKLWYGFKCISDNAALIANCIDDIHSPEYSLTKVIGDSSIPYSW
jgi:dTDP-4-dehydrorhamnose 3,5-epimerase